VELSAVYEGQKVENCTAREINVAKRRKRRDKQFHSCKEGIYGTLNTIHTTRVTWESQCMFKIFEISVAILTIHTAAAQAKCPAPAICIRLWHLTQNSSWPRTEPKSLIPSQTKPPMECIPLNSSYHIFQLDGPPLENRRLSNVQVIIYPTANGFRWVVRSNGSLASSTQELVSSTRSTVWERTVP